MTVSSRAAERTFSEVSIAAGMVLTDGGEDPVEGEDAEESGPAGFAVPAAGGIGAQRTCASVGLLRISNLLKRRGSVVSPARLLRSRTTRGV
jgi:hypothetical protein